jgi:hypothetical protein
MYHKKFNGRVCKQERVAVFDWTQMFGNIFRGVNVVLLGSEGSFSLELRNEHLKFELKQLTNVTTMFKVLPISKRQKRFILLHLYFILNI